MHIAIYLTNQADKDQLIASIQQGKFPILEGVTGKTIEVFSKSRLQYFLREEYQHERFEITGSADKPLSQLSEGEQKKALLEALLKRQPEVLILDDVFDSLDASAQNSLLQQLQQLARSCQLIQLFTRQRDQLAFIQHVYYWQDGALQPFAGNHVVVEALDIRIPPPFEQPSQFANPLIAMRDISVAFADKKVIRKLDWTVNNGEFWQLTGPNGAGKSTLLRMISGDSAKGYGQNLHLFGRKKGTGESVWDIKRHLGYFTSSMVQNFSRHENLEDMLVSGFFDSVGLYIKPHARHYQLAHQWLHAIGLEAKAKMAFHSLNPGHQRLLLVARAMVKHPPLLILDEPASGLDDKDVQRLISLVNAMAKTKHSAIIYVSHRQEVGLSADKTLQLIPGEQGATARIVHSER